MLTYPALKCTARDPKQGTDARTGQTLGGRSLLVRSCLAPSPSLCSPTTKRDEQSPRTIKVNAPLILPTFLYGSGQEREVCGRWRVALAGNCQKRLQKAQKRKRKTTNLVIFWRATRHAK